MQRILQVLVLVCLMGIVTRAQVPQGATVRGRVTDASGGVLPGVAVEIEPLPGGGAKTAVTSATGDFVFESVAGGRYQLSFMLINFATVVHRDIVVASAPVVVDAVMHLALNAEVTVTGKRTFVNLADVENPAENLVGVAQSASQGAITAQQLDVRPLMRTGEVLETVPGVIISQHSGEGKANQYFLRGFNLDHGTDLAQTVAGLPVNMPSHAHGQGYSDLNFMIPELVSGVQFSKGPYFADQGDFATAGATNISYVTMLDRPIAHIDAGGEGYGRALLAASPAIGTGRLLVAGEVMHNDGPWVNADDYRKVNGVMRYSRGDALNGWALTGMGYHGSWNSSDQLALRAITSGLVSRFGAIDPTDGGHSYRYSGSFDWQRATTSTLTKATAYGIGYDLHLFSNFTYYLDDPVRGDQFEQADHRFVSGGRIFQRHQAKWRGHEVQWTYGAQLRNDDISTLGLYHTQRRVRLETRSEAQVLETEFGLYAQNEVAWTPWLRTMVGLRGDAARFRVNAADSANSGLASDSLMSPKLGLTLGPWRGTEFYVNAGTGFHSNDARGTTITRDAGGNAVDQVTPLVRAKGAEVGVRTVAVPHLQTTASLWMLDLDSELVFAGDEGVSEPSRPSRRYGLEWANYYSPRKWLTFDFDASWSHSRFTAFDPAGPFIPEAVGTVVSAGATVDNLRRIDAAVRWRYFGPRTLIEDNSQRSQATSLINLDAGYRVAKNVRINLEVFNLFNASDADIDYFYVSRLPGEPADGVEDIHTHPTIPRTARVSVHVGF